MGDLLGSRRLGLRIVNRRRLALQSPCVADQPLIPVEMTAFQRPSRLMLRFLMRVEWQVAQHSECLCHFGFLRSLFFNSFQQFGFVIAPNPLPGFLCGLAAYAKSRVVCHFMASPVVSEAFPPTTSTVRLE